MATAAPVEKIDIGRVIGRGFEALKANFLFFFLCSAVLSGVPAFLIQYLPLEALRGGRASDYLTDGTFAWVGGLGVLASFIGGMILQGILVRSTVLTLSGREPEAGQSLLIALRLTLPILGLSILVGLAIMVGLMLLIVPGIMIYCAYSVSVPALIEERRGVFDSMQRSRDLTRNSRKRIFVLMVVVWVFSIIISTVLNVIGGVDPAGMTLTGQLPNPVLAGAMAGLGAALTSAIFAVFLAALYVELRTVKEGASTDDLATIFE